VRLVARVFVSLLLTVVLVAAVFGGALGLHWLDGRGVFDLALDRRPEQPVALSSLNRYTHEAAGKAWFRRYFTTMVFSQAGDAPTGNGPIVAKWERRQVVIKLLNDGGPGVERYLRQLVRRLDRLQPQVRFVVGDAAPRITIRFLAHDDYVKVAGPDSVGSTSTHYYGSSPGLISARIFIDEGRQAAPGERRATLIHELTHAWQYQHVGWTYLVRALAAQFRYGTAAYDFGGEANLVKCRQNHWTITKFNPEQQGDIARCYYDCLRSTNAIDEPNKQNALSAYKPYISDIQEMASAAQLRSQSAER